jgi:mRNA-degrading endonuclease RelE of RelBE toxin-antitoxin system
LTPKHQLQLAAKIQSLRGNPWLGVSKSVDGFDGYLRFDSGIYRFIFRVVYNVAVLLFASLNNQNNEQLFKLSLRLNI